MNKTHSKTPEQKLTQSRQAAKERRKKNARFCDSTIFWRDHLLAIRDALQIFSALSVRWEVRSESDG
jgi:hypothetical protein